MPKFYKEGLQVITIPKKMINRIEKFKRLKDINEKERELKSLRSGNPAIPIVTCKNPRINFNYGQTYKKFDKVPLASQVWGSRKVKKDYFIIHKHSEIPALHDRNCSLSFESLGLNESVVNQLKKCGFECPTNIQSLAIPVILNRHNTIISAETGNGKTLSFLAPIVQQILHEKSVNSNYEAPLNCPLALIILPSRELVTQTRDTTRALTTDLDIKVNAIFGGRTKRMMLTPRVFENDILIGSFGAISKLFTSGVFGRTRLRHVVLDEADTLLDDSFSPKMLNFLKKCMITSGVDQMKGLNSEEQENADLVGAQLTLVGATFPTSLQRILKDVISVDSFKQIRTSYLHRISPHITQKFLKLSSYGRLEALMKIAKQNNRTKTPTVIFCNTASSSNYVAKFLNENDVPCINMNSSVGYHLRINRFEKFQKGEVNFIACTDLVSRGLDTVRAKHVVNFDFPKFISDYIHRCGRTGRVGSVGDCLVTNFIFSEDDAKLVQKIEYAARKIEDLPNVNANIKRALVNQAEKKKEMQYEEMEAKADAEQMEQEMKLHFRDELPKGKY